MVLTYHQIAADDSSYRYSLSSRGFAEHLKVLTECGLTAGPEPVRVTFDDGHLSQHQYALPLLERFKVRGTFYITAGWTGNHSSYMSAAQLRELASLGHQVHAHGWSHKMLTRCSPSTLHQELYRSKNALEDILGMPVDAMSAPHGRWNDHVLAVCSEAGYKELYISDPSVRKTTGTGLRVIGRAMVTRSIRADALPSFIRSGAVGSMAARYKSVIKTTLRTVIGENHYHQLWRALSSKQDDLPDIECSARPPTVLQLISSGGYYGAENMIVNLASSLNDNGCQTVIAAFRNRQNPHTEVTDRAAHKKIATEVIPCSGRADWKAIQGLRKVIHKYGVDVVHTHGSKANTYGVLATVALGVPLVATYHMAWPDRGFLLFCYHLLDRPVLRRFAKVAAVSDAVERSLRNSGVNTKKLTTIANGIDVTPFVEAAARPAENRPGKVIGLIGRLTPAKGHQYLLEAARDILAQFPDTIFLFVGDGAERERLERLAEAAGVMGSVVFAGQRSDMPETYVSIDILVLPSVIEGLPMTLIEALAARRPVIATNVGDIPKLIHHEETGLLIPPADTGALKLAILRLLSDPKLSAKLATAGQRLVCESFCATTMARQYRALYDDVLNRNAINSRDHAECSGNHNHIPKS